MNRALRQLRIAAAESPNGVRPTGPADPMRSPVYPAKHDSRRWAPNAIGLGALLGIGALAGWLITDHLALFALLGVGGLTIISIIASAHGETHAAASNMTNIGTVSLDSALRSLAAIAEERDRELAGHSERVAENSVRIGQELGLSSNELHKLWWAGLKSKNILIMGRAFLAPSVVMWQIFPKRFVSIMRSGTVAVTH